MAFPGDQRSPVRMFTAKAPSRQAMVFAPGPGRLVRRPDRLAVEEPLEVRLSSPRGTSTLGITMRTPGNDMELVAGLLLAEGVIDGADDLASIAYCVGGAGRGSAADRDPNQYNVVTARLRRPPRRAGRERQTVTSSACGACGTASIDALRAVGHPVIGPGPRVAVDWLCALPGLLRREQLCFDETGTVHAAGLAEPGGELLVVREDVGRHNAVDKVVGWALCERRLPLGDAVLVVSGRVSFEIVQKAVRAGIGVVVAVSGATSLAVALAAELGVTLVGFVRDGRCTVYSGPERLAVG